jgi:hypothetical protein
MEQINSQVPWSQDYPTHYFEIVSPELPAGSAWLVNCLLELGIPVWNPWEVNIDSEWQRLSLNKYRYIEPNGLWQQTLPALQKNRVFDFNDKASGRASHRWAGTIERGKKLILFVRDPRDLLYSQWRRTNHNMPDFDLSFEAFIESKYHHYPIDHITYVYLFLNLWKTELNNFNHHIVRFEDYKMKPLETLRDVVHFLGFSFSDETLNDAVQQSSFQVVKQVENQLAGLGLLERKFNFAGKPFEYKEHLSAAIRNQFFTEMNEICRWLGYEPISQKNYNLPLNPTVSWKSQMIDCVFNGGGNDIQRQLFHHILSDSFDHRNGLKDYEHR